ncbi:hypothetical protein N2152v2_001378 [Parachlorella kessleri]
MRALQAIQRAVYFVSPGQPATGLFGTTVGKWRGFFASSTAFEAEPAQAEEFFKEAQSEQPSGYVDLENDFDRDDPEAVDKANLWAKAEPRAVPIVDLELELDHAVNPEVVDKAQLWAKPKPTEVPNVELGLEMDHAFDPEAVDKAQLWAPAKPTVVPQVDLDDDPEAVDKEELWRVRAQQPLQNVNLDDEMDLIHEEAQEAA